MKGRIQIVLLAILVSLVAGCSSSFKYKVLNTLFDDVPEQSTIDNMSAVDSLMLTDSTNGASTANFRVTKMTIHEPYRTKECGACHDKNTMGGFIDVEPYMCYQCHDNFNEKYTYVHGPVAIGLCTECHAPHTSQSDNLLVRAGRDLCFYCHDEHRITNTTIHADIGQSSCATCHNPHGGNNKFVFQEGACFNCHDDFRESYNVLHGPVAGGYCASCHDEHGKGSENLLLRTGRDLCLACHDENDVMKITIHQENKNNNCLECHNPHGGEDQFVLK